MINSGLNKKYGNWCHEFIQCSTCISLNKSYHNFHTLINLNEANEYELFPLSIHYSYGSSENDPLFGVGGKLSIQYKAYLLVTNNVYSLHMVDYLGNDYVFAVDNSESFPESKYYVFYEINTGMRAVAENLDGGNLYRAHIYVDSNTELRFYLSSSESPIVKNLPDKIINQLGREMHIIYENDVLELQFPKNIKYTFEKGAGNHTIISSFVFENGDYVLKRTATIVFSNNRIGIITFADSNNHLLNEIRITHFPSSKIKVSDAMSNEEIEYSIDGDGFIISEYSFLTRNTFSFEYNDNITKITDLNLNRSTIYTFSSDSGFLYSIENFKKIISISEKNSFGNVVRQVDELQGNGYLDENERVLKNGFFLNSLSSWTRSGSFTYDLLSDDEVFSQVSGGNAIRISRNAIPRFINKTLFQKCDYEGNIGDSWTLLFFVRTNYPENFYPLVMLDLHNGSNIVGEVKYNIPESLKSANFYYPIVVNITASSIYDSISFTLNLVNRTDYFFDIGGIQLIKKEIKSYKYDEHNLVKEIKSGNNIEALTVFNGSLSSFSNVLSSQYQEFSYYQDSNKIHKIKTISNSGTSTVVFDVNGNATQKTTLTLDACKRDEIYEYDVSENKIREKNADNIETLYNHSIINEWITNESSCDSSVAFSYNSQRNLSEEEFYFNDSYKGKTKYLYQNVNSYYQLLSSLSSYNDSHVLTNSVHFNYNDDYLTSYIEIYRSNQVWSNLISIHYDSEGTDRYPRYVSKEEYGQYSYIQYNYDSFDKLLSITHQYNQTGSIIYSFTYDSSDRLTSETRTIGGVVDYTKSYTYDIESRVTNIVRGGYQEHLYYDNFSSLSYATYSIYSTLQSSCLFDCMDLKKLSNYLKSTKNTLLADFLGSFDLIGDSKSREHRIVGNPFRLEDPLYDSFLNLFYINFTNNYSRLDYNLNFNSPKICLSLKVNPSTVRDDRNTFFIQLNLLNYYLDICFNSLGRIFLSLGFGGRRITSSNISTHYLNFDIWNDLSIFIDTENNVFKININGSIETLTFRIPAAQLNFEQIIVSPSILDNFFIGSIAYLLINHCPGEETFDEIQKLPNQIKSSSLVNNSNLPRHMIFSDLTKAKDEFGNYTFYSLHGNLLDLSGNKMRYETLIDEHFIYQYSSSINNYCYYNANNPLVFESDLHTTGLISFNLNILSQNDGDEIFILNNNDNSICCYIFNQNFYLNIFGQQVNTGISYTGDFKRLSFTYLIVSSSSPTQVVFSFRYNNLDFSSSVSADVTVLFDKVKIYLGCDTDSSTHIFALYESLILNNAYVPNLSSLSILNVNNYISYSKVFLDGLNRPTMIVNYTNGNLSYYEEDSYLRIDGNDTMLVSHQSINDFDINYQYDSQNRFKRVQNLVTNYDVIYEYNDKGYLTSVRDNNLHLLYSYQYDEKGNMTQYFNSNENITHLYEYDYCNRIIRIDGKNVNYSNEIDNGFGLISSIGNDTYFTYRTGKLFLYHKNLDSGYIESQNEYDSNGLRFKKRVTEFDGFLSETYLYFYEYTDSKLTFVSYQNNNIFYLYNGRDIPYGFKLNGVMYYFVVNAMGIIDAILDENENVVAKYIYDPYGKIENVINLTTPYVGNINIIRYKGYIYDDETGLYWLQSRFYNPNIARFMSPDSLDYLDHNSIIGLNLFAYCNNNPIIYSDICGHMPEWLSTTLKIFGGVAIIAGCVVGSIFTCGTLSVILAGAAVGAISSGISAGISTAVSGGDIHDFGNAFLMNTVTGSLSGAAAACPLGIWAEIGINAALGIANYIGTQGLNGDAVTLGGLITSGGFGAVCGLVGQFGWMKDMPAALFGGLGVKNAMRHILFVAGKESLCRIVVPTLIVGGLGGGIYGRIKEHYNCYGDFAGI